MSRVRVRKNKEEKKEKERERERKKEKKKTNVERERKRKNKGFAALFRIKDGPTKKQNGLNAGPHEERLFLGAVLVKIANQNHQCQSK
jgi:hypothetical protein